MKDDLFMERISQTDRLQKIYYDLETRHGFKVCWHPLRDQIVLPGSIPVSCKDEIENMADYIRIPALVDPFVLHADRNSFWRRYGALDVLNSDKYIVYSGNRLRLNRIIGLQWDLFYIGNETRSVFPGSLQFVNKTFEYLSSYIKGLKEAEDHYPEPVTLAVADTITEKLHAILESIHT